VSGLYVKTFTEMDFTKQRKELVLEESFNQCREIAH